MGVGKKRGGSGAYSGTNPAVAADILTGKTVASPNGVITGTLDFTGNAAVGDVANGKTFYNTDTIKKTGTLSLTGDAAVGDVANGKTFYNADFTKRTGTLTLSGNAVASEVLNTKTFYSNSFTKLTGSMANNGALNITPSGSVQTSGAGYYSGISVAAVPDTLFKRFVEKTGSWQDSQSGSGSTVVTATVTIPLGVSIANAVGIMIVIEGSGSCALQGYGTITWGYSAGVPTQCSVMYYTGSNYQWIGIGNSSYSANASLCTPSFSGNNLILSNSSGPVTGGALASLNIRKVLVFY